MPTKLDINSATKEELVQFQGISNDVANKIIKIRTEKGEIKSIETLAKDLNLPVSTKTAVEENFIISSEVQAHKGFLSASGILGKPDLFIGTQNNFELAVAIPVHSFSIQINTEGAATTKKYDLYKVIVEYHLMGTQSQRMRNSREYNVNQNGLSNISFEGYLSTPVITIQVYSAEHNLIFSSSYDIESIKEEDASLAILLPAGNITNFNIHLVKQGPDYPGFLLLADFEIRQNNALIQKKSLEFEVFGKDNIEATLHHLGKVEQIVFSLKSAEGEIIWTKNQVPNNNNNYSLTLPKPTSLDFRVDVKVATVPDNPFAGHFLIVNFDVKDYETGLAKKKGSLRIELDQEGETDVDLDYFGIIDELQFEVQSPTGEILGRKKVKVEDIQTDETIFIEIPKKQIAALMELPKLPVRPKKTVGRVIEALARRPMDKIQVVMYAAVAEDPNDEDFYPIEILVTEAEGYFSLDTPQDPVTKAFARVGLLGIDGNPIDVPIRLEEGIISYKKLVQIDGEDSIETVEEVKTYFPAKLILVVNTEPVNIEGHDCSCDCKELDFHQPKKVLEEFSFYSVVRTTEPQIKGYTLEDDGEMTIHEIYDTIPILNDAGTLADAVNLPENFRDQKIKKSVLQKFVNSKNGITLQTLNKALNASNAIALQDKIRPQKDVRAVGRYELDATNPIDWDEDPTIYQATSLAHGHILHFKQEWMNDGYSIGDLLYSLPLAPGQKKQIVIIDSEARDSASRSETLDYEEQLDNSLSRDRDVNEIALGVLSESTSGSSNAKSSGWSAGKSSAATGTIYGISFGSVLAGSGGSSKANSNAWQNSTRSSALNSLQQIRDRTMQSANAVRSQRATVVQTSTQSERLTVQTESIANYNHCHAITIQYFEVMRHMKAQQRLADVQECLFVPLIMSTFDHQKILRWREALSRYVFDRRLRRGFDAIERIENNYEGSDLPDGMFADENIEYLEGHIYLVFQLNKPVGVPPVDANNNGFVQQNWNFLKKLHPSLFDPHEFYSNHLFGITNQMEVFEKMAGPSIAEAFVQHLRFMAIADDGSGGQESGIVIPIDATLMSGFRNNQNLYVTLRIQSKLPVIKRSAIKYIQIEGNGVAADGTSYAAMRELLPEGSRVIVQSGTINYRTKHISSNLFNNSRIQNDLSGLDAVRIYTPLNPEEMRNPRNEDIELANALRDHLNDNLEFFHKAIWWNMSAERRFMFLDGIQVTDYSEKDQYPAGVVRSVASVVENRTIGIVGNNLIMPVAPGFRLDPNMKGQEVDLFSLYKPTTPPDPLHISIPTKGVFAEAVMGKCNSCEKKEEERFWRWSEEPIPDNPTAIMPISTDSRKTAVPDLKPTPLPTPMINIQNAPSVPDPQGFGAVASLLQQPAFDNITGLAANQQNAADALKQSFDVTRAMGEKAAELAALSANLNAIKDANKSNLLSNDKAQDATEDYIKHGETGKSLNNIKQVREMIKNGDLSEELGTDLIQKIMDGISGKEKTITDDSSLKKLINRTAEYGDGSIKIEQGEDAFEYAPAGNTETKDNNESNGNAVNIIEEPILKKIAELRSIPKYDPYEFANFSTVSSLSDQKFQVDTDGLTHVIIGLIAGDKLIGNDLLQDLEEIKAGITSPQFGFIGLVDLGGYYTAANNIADLRSYVIWIDKNGIKTIENWGDINISNEKVSTVFLTRALSSFKSVPRKAVSFSGHGNTSGLLYDTPDYTTFGAGPSIIYNSSLKTIFQKAFQLSGINNKIDLISIDACLNGMVEVLVQVKDFTEVFVGSQRLVPSTGNDYVKIFNDMKSDAPQDAVEWGRIFVRSFGLQYMDEYLKDRKDGVILSAFKTQSCENLILEIKSIVSSIMALAVTSDDEIRNFIKARKKSQQIDGVVGTSSGNTKKIKFNSYDLVDFFSNLAYLTENDDIRVKCLNVKDWFDAIYISKRVFGKDYNKLSGLSIWIPDRESQLKDALDYGKLDFDLATTWSILVEKTL